ncbi:MAG: helix-turn-helix transcriptional regulator [Clostridia bacterium]|nr:helix-turn-helix transcriptional regulator [Clostridia bacterium]
MFSENLSVFLLQYCEQMGLSQERLAERCGVSVRYIGRIICRHSVPTIAVLEKLCTSLHMTPNDLLLSIAIVHPSYRQPMEVVAFYQLPHEDVYGICPRCRAIIDREYQAYCDSCGQQLSWKRISQATFHALLPAPDEE